jgi:hypothetical protein
VSACFCVARIAARLRADRLHSSRCDAISSASTATRSCGSTQERTSTRAARNTAASRRAARSRSTLAKDSDAQAGAWSASEIQRPDGLAIGLAEALWPAYLDGAYRDVVIFTALITMLIVRPSGLFGDPGKTSS